MKNGKRLELVLGITWLGSRRTKGNKGSIVSKINIAWTAWAALLGTALGVSAIIVSLAVMNGYRNNLVRVMASALPHVSIEWENYASQAQAKEQEQEQQEQRQKKQLRDWLTGYQVIDITSYTTEKAVLTGPKGISAVLLRGLRVEDVSRDESLLKLLKSDAEPHQLAFELDKTTESGTRPIWFSQAMGDRLGVKLGDTLQVLDVQNQEHWMPQPQPLLLSLTGWLETGVSAFDGLVAVVGLSTLTTLFPASQQKLSFGLRLASPLKSNEVAQVLRGRLSADSSYVYSWLENNQELFKLISIQKTALFIVLFLIVVMALFGMAGTLSMLVCDKKREIAVLSALGISHRKIKHAFIFQGMLIGGNGCLLGISLGLGICWAFNNWASLKLPAGIYPGSSQVPILLLWQDIAFVTVAVLAASTLGAFIPAKQASETHIIQALHS